MLILEEGIGGDFAEVGEVPAHGEVHFGQLVGGGGELLPVDGDVLLAARFAARRGARAADLANSVLALPFNVLFHPGKSFHWNAGAVPLRRESDS